MRSIWAELSRSSRSSRSFPGAWSGSNGTYCCSENDQNLPVGGRPGGGPPSTFLFFVVGGSGGSSKEFLSLAKADLSVLSEGIESAVFGGELLSLLKSTH
jgi:hypothetical protein